MYGRPVDLRKIEHVEREKAETRAREEQQRQVMEKATKGAMGMAHIKVITNGNPLDTRIIDTETGDDIFVGCLIAVRYVADASDELQTCRTIIECDSTVEWEFRKNGESTY